MPTDTRSEIGQQAFRLASAEKWAERLSAGGHWIEHLVVMPTGLLVLAAVMSDASTRDQVRGVTAVWIFAVVMSAGATALRYLRSCHFCRALRAGVQVSGKAYESGEASACILLLAALLVLGSTDQLLGTEWATFVGLIQLGLRLACIAHASALLVLVGTRLPSWRADRCGPGTV